VTPWILLAIALSCSAGFAVCSAFWEQPESTSAQIAKFFLGAGLGTGLTSCALFLGLVAGRPKRSDLLLLDCIVLVTAVIFSVFMKRLSSISPSRPNAGDKAPRLIAYALTVPFLAAAVVAARLGIRKALLLPNGEWDAWMIWTLRARFLFRSLPDWRAAFAGGLNLSHAEYAPDAPVQRMLEPLNMSHLDYPLCLPASIVRFWVYSGNEARNVPLMLGFAFLVCAAGLAMSGLAMLRSTSQALLAGIVLLTTPFLIDHAVSGYAESPLIFFILATVILIILSDYAPRALVLAGMSAGFAAWTKNEGLLFLSCAALTLLLAPLVTRDSRTLFRNGAFFMAGVLPVLFVILLFKFQVHTGDWLFGPGGAGGSPFRRVIEFSRYALVAKTYAREIVRFGEWPVSMVPVLILYALLLGRKAGLRRKPGLLAASAAVMLTFAGGFMVYVITPTPLSYQLASSLNRILLELWPAAIFLFFCIVRTPEEALGNPQNINA
jgi:hypothetical protein